MLEPVGTARGAHAAPEPLLLLVTGPGPIVVDGFERRLRGGRVLGTMGRGFNLCTRKGGIDHFMAEINRPKLMVGSGGQVHGICR